MLLHLATQRPNFSVLLFNHLIQALAFLAQQSYLIFSLGTQLLVCIFKLLDFALHHVALVTNNLELVLKFAQSASRKTEIFLDSPHFLIKSVVLS